MLTQQLDIYKTTYSFVRDYINRYQRIKALHRYTLGKQIYSMSLELFGIIENANRSVDTRADYLTEYLVKLNTIKTLIRLAGELKIIRPQDSAVLGDYIANLSRQATAWKKFAR